MKTKITISKDGRSVFLKAPYKKGYVVWKLEAISDVSVFDLPWDVDPEEEYTHVWTLYSKKREHHPERVLKWHCEYLFGQKLMYAIRRTASAKHHYELLEQLVTMEIHPTILY